MNPIVIRPQKGKQEQFLRTNADICVYGGAAGGGKSYALLLECLRHIDNPRFEAVVFRQTRPQILSAGGLFATSQEIYPLLGATSILMPNVQWRFPSGAKVTFSHMLYEKDKFNWQGAQIPALMFDELTQFSEGQFFYLLSRNRSACGVKPYIRATCNPDVDSWVAKFIAWWIDQQTGYPIEERSGKLRWFCRVDGIVQWGSTPEDLVRSFGVDPSVCKSVTFIASSVYDNQKLLSVNPEYLAALNSLALVERERLLNGNWRIRPAAGLYFRSEQTRIVKEIPDKIVAIGRAWDLAATEITSDNTDPDRTASCLMARMRNGQYIILDAKRVAASASAVHDLVRSTAATDKVEYKCKNISIPQDPGQAGKEQAQSYIQELSGYHVKSEPTTGNKVARAEPFAAQWQRGNVLLLEGRWNETLLDELEGFPDAAHDDQVDAASDAFAMVASAGNYSTIPHDAFIGRNSYWR